MKSTPFGRTLSNSYNNCDSVYSMDKKLIICCAIETKMMETNMITMVINTVSNIPHTALNAPPKKMALKQKYRNTAKATLNVRTIIRMNISSRENTQEAAR